MVKTDDAVGNHHGHRVEPTIPERRAASNPVHIYVTDPNGKTTSYRLHRQRHPAGRQRRVLADRKPRFPERIPDHHVRPATRCAPTASPSALPAGNTLLGCRGAWRGHAAPVRGTSSPSGLLGRARVSRSWRPAGPVDPGMTRQSVPVHVYVKSPGLAPPRARYVGQPVPRPDVNRALNMTGNHGYRIVIPVTTRGKYTVCVSAPGRASCAPACPASAAVPHLLTELTDGQGGPPMALPSFGVSPSR